LFVSALHSSAVAVTIAAEVKKLAVAADKNCALEAVLLEVIPLD
jgi:hypothetical protein